MSINTEIVVNRFVYAINRHDIDALRNVMTDDHTFIDSLGNRFSGAEKMISGWQHFFHTYPDYNIKVEQAFEGGDHVALAGVASGGWRVDGQVLPQRWSVRAAWVALIKNGRVGEWCVFCDTGWAKPPKT